MIKEKVDIKCAKYFDKHLVFYRPPNVAAKAEKALKVSITSNDLTASTWTECNYRMLAEFFHEMARDWKGWQGEKVFRAKAEEMELRATSDRLGHIRLEIKLAAKNRNFSTWNIETHIILEAGKLELLAQEIKELLRDEVEA